MLKNLIVNHSFPIFLGIIMTLTFTISSCKKDPIIENEEELITSLTYHLVPRGGGDNVVFSFKDLDGDGGSPPIFTNGKLQPNTTYDGTLTLLNDIASPVIDITAEVLEEGTDHQFFYASSPIDVLDVWYNDLDSQSLPIGIKTILSTGDSQSGKLKITLRHAPFKNADGVVLGLIDNAGGQTDIEVVFDISY